LGVQPAAEPSDVRKAYLLKAKELHPDVSPDPESQTRFQALTEAYEVLSDPELRAEYDQARRPEASPFPFGTPQPRRPDKPLSETQRKFYALGAIAGMMTFYRIIGGIVLPGKKRR